MFSKIKKIVVYIMIFVGLIIVGSVCFLYMQKDRIVQSTLQYLTKQIPYKITLNRVKYLPLSSFPNLTFLLNNVVIQEKNTENILKAKNIELTFNLKEIFQKKYIPKKLTIKHSNVHIVVQPINTVSKQKKKDVNTNFSLPAQIFLQNVTINYIHKGKNKKKSAVHIKQMKVQPYWKAKRLFIPFSSLMNSIKINVDRYTYTLPKIRINTTLYYDFENKFFKATKVELQQGQNYFLCSGDYYSNQRYKISFCGKKVLLSSLDSYGINYLYPLTGILQFQAQITCEKTMPRCTAKFYIEKGTCTLPYTEIENKIILNNIQGEFLLPNFKKLSQAELHIDEFGLYWQKNAFKGKLKLKDIKNPCIQGAIQGEIDCATLQKKKINPFFPTKGKVNVSLEVKDFFSLKKIHHMQPEGKVKLSKLTLPLGKGLVPMQDIEAEIALKKNRWEVLSMEAAWKKNIFTLQGSLDNPLHFIYKNVHIPLNIDMKMTSSEIHIQSLDFQQEKNVEKENVKHFPIHFNLDYKIDNLFFDKLHMKNFVGKMHYTPENLAVKQLNFGLAGGNCSAQGKIYHEKNTKIKHFSTQINCENVQIPSVLSMTHNLGQKIFTAQNIQGIFSGQLILQGKIQNQHIANYLQGSLKIKMKNMVFDQVEPLQRVTQYFQHQEKKIYLDHLENVLTIQDGKIIMPSMTVHLRNCLQINVSGQHSFQNVYKYHMVIPMKNFSKKYRKKKLGIIQEKAIEGLNLQLVLKGKNSQYSVHYDTQALGKILQKHYQKQKKDLKDIFTGKYQKKKKSLVLSDEEVAWVEKDKN